MFGTKHLLPMHLRQKCSLQQQKTSEVDCVCCRAPTGDSRGLQQCGLYVLQGVDASELLLSAWRKEKRNWIENSKTVPNLNKPTNTPRHTRCKPDQTLSDGAERHTAIMRSLSLRGSACGKTTLLCTWCSIQRNINCKAVWHTQDPSRFFSKKTKKTSVLTNNIGPWQQLHFMSKKLFFMRHGAQVSAEDSAPNEMHSSDAQSALCRFLAVPKEDILPVSDSTAGCSQWDLVPNEYQIHPIVKKQGWFRSPFGSHRLEICCLQPKETLQ